jgi:hypothetical protein
MGQGATFIGICAKIECFLGKILRGPFGAVVFWENNKNLFYCVKTVFIYSKTHNFDVIRRKNVIF